MKNLKTTAEVIDELGGNEAVAERMDVKVKTVWHWRNTKQFPSNTYVMLTKDLSAAGKSAPVSLWSMKMPER